MKATVGGMIFCLKYQQGRGRSGDVFSLWKDRGERCKDWGKSCNKQVGKVIVGFSRATGEELGVGVGGGGTTTRAKDATGCVLSSWGSGWEGCPTTAEA